MVEIEYTPEFEEEYRRLSALLKKRAQKQEGLFRSNPFHPSLNTEKLEPHSMGVWSFRVDIKFRVIFKFLGNSHVRFLNVGPHDWIYRLKF